MLAEHILLQQWFILLQRTGLATGEHPIPCEPPLVISGALTHWIGVTHYMALWRRRDIHSYSYLG